MIKVNNISSDRTVFACIDPLSHDIKKEQLRSWTDQVNTLAYSYQRVANSATEVFWSTLIHNSSFLFSFDSALEYIPKGHSLERFQLVHRWDAAAAKAVEALRFQIIVIYCRVQVFPSKIDSTLNKHNWLEYSQKIMPFSRAARVWALYPQKTDLFSKLISCGSKVMENPQQAVRELITEFQSEITHYEQAVRPLFQQYSNSSGICKIKVAGLVRKFLYLVADIIYTCNVSLDVLRNTGLLSDLSPFIQRVPFLVEAIENCFPVGVLMDIAAILPGWPMRNLLRINSYIEQGAVKLFKKGLDLTNNEEKYRLVNGILRCERFLFIDKDLSGFTSDLSKFTTGECRKIEEALQLAAKTQGPKLVQRVEEQGLLQSLGEIDSLRPEQRLALDELKDVFQHMSLPYLHLCLRHFNYDCAYTIESMLSADHKMPVELRQMENLARPSSAEPTLPTLSFKELDMIDEGIKQSQSAPFLFDNRTKIEEKNSFKGLFSLAPVTPAKASVSSTGSSVSSTSTLPNIIESLRLSLDRSKAHASKSRPKKEAKVYEGIKGEKLVPLPAPITKFKTTAEDKVAIRPTYEQYKYETHFEEDDLYNDEYDDGYETREFQVEPLNEPLAAEDESGEEGEGESEIVPGASTRSSDRGNIRGRGFRGDRGNTRGRGSRGGGNRGGKPPNYQAHPETEEGPTTRGSNNNYTGGRQRQMKERHKNEWKQRGADRKRRGAFIA